RVANLLHSTAIHLLRAAAVADRSLGLTPERLSLLSVLVFGGPTSIGGVADIEGISAPALSRSVTALEELGLVAKVRQRDDQRVVLVEATAVGHELLDTGRLRRLSIVVQLLEGLSDREMATIQRSCELINLVT